MKTAIKVFNILTIIACVTIICGIATTFLLFLRTQDKFSFVLMLGLFVLLTAIMLCPTVILIIGIYRISKATKKSDLIVIGILTLLFANIISGILMLTIKENALTR